MILWRFLLFVLYLHICKGIALNIGCIQDSLSSKKYILAPAFDFGKSVFSYAIENDTALIDLIAELKNMESGMSIISGKLTTNWELLSEIKPHITSKFIEKLKEINEYKLKTIIGEIENGPSDYYYEAIPFARNFLLLP